MQERRERLSLSFAKKCLKHEELYDMFPQICQLLELETRKSIMLNTLKLRVTETMHYHFSKESLIKVLKMKENS